MITAPECGEEELLPICPEIPDGERPMPRSVHEQEEGDLAQTPVIPLPNPGEGGPITDAPGNWLPGFLRPAGASVRFLNAAYGYPAFRIMVERKIRTRHLSYSALSDYSRVASGYRTITVVGPDGYVYLQKSLPFRGNSVSTVAVINRPGGLDLIQISDLCCHPGGGWSNIRLCNLAHQSGPVDMLLADGRVLYTDVQFKETTSFKRIRPGAYEFWFTDTDQQPMPRYEDVETLDSEYIGIDFRSDAAGLYLNVKPNTNYTVFLLTGCSFDQVMAIAAEGK